MQITVFGASGRTGKPLLEQALAGGHTVKAFVRTPSKLDIQHDNLHIVQGDVYNAEQVAEAVQGSDAVLSALGHGKGTPPDMQTVATKHIISAMNQHGVKRFISLTGAGVADPNDEPKVVDRIIKFMLKTLSGKVLADAENHAELLRQSDLDWTIVRGPMLTEGPHTGEYRVGYVGKGSGTRISRADVADFMLALVEDEGYIHKAPMVSD